MRLSLFVFNKREIMRDHADMEGKLNPWLKRKQELYYVQNHISPKEAFESWMYFFS